MVSCGYHLSFTVCDLRLHLYDCMLLLSLYFIHSSVFLSFYLKVGGTADGKWTGPLCEPYDQDNTMGEAHKVTTINYSKVFPLAVNK